MSTTQSSTRRSHYASSTCKIAVLSCTILVLSSFLNVSSLTSLFPKGDIHRAVSTPHFKPVLEPVPTHRKKGTLPNFDNGGIVVFYHIYKTGGSTIGKMLHELSRDDQIFHDKVAHGPNITDAQNSSARLFFTMIRKHVDWEMDCLPLLKLAESKKKLVLLELHVEHPSPDFPSLVELAPTIELWRAEAVKRGLGFFAFTMIREPVAHALSFFNFFHVGHNQFRPAPSREDHDHWNPFKPLTGTEKNFLKSYYANNRQCRMLSTDPESTKGAPKSLVWDEKKVSQEDLKESRQPCEIDKVHDVLFDSMDWVGTTEKLSNETLPLLTQLVMNNPSIGRKNKPFKVYDNHPESYGKKGMKPHDLSRNTFSTIMERTKLDRGLYQKVVQEIKLTDLGWDYVSPAKG